MDPSLFHHNLWAMALLRWNTRRRAHTGGPQSTRTTDEPNLCKAAVKTTQELRRWAGGSPTHTNSPTATGAARGQPTVPSRLPTTHSRRARAGPGSLRLRGGGAIVTGGGPGGAGGPGGEGGDGGGMSGAAAPPLRGSQPRPPAAANGSSLASPFV